MRAQNLYLSLCQIGGRECDTPQRLEIIFLFAIEILIIGLDLPHQLFSTHACAVQHDQSFLLS
jgi:hypothetical protein